MRGGNVFLNENVLLPLNPEIKIFTGEENSTVGGKNYKKTLTKDAVEKSSKQFALENSDRIEIRSEKREKDETFFNVFSTWDNSLSETQIEDAKLVQTEDFDCALIKNYAVCFAKDSAVSIQDDLFSGKTVFVIKKLIENNTDVKIKCFQLKENKNSWKKVEKFAKEIGAEFSTDVNFFNNPNRKNSNVRLPESNIIEFFTYKKNQELAPNNKFSSDLMRISLISNSCNNLSFFLSFMSIFSPTNFSFKFKLFSIS